jgi:predicted membrane channel-forming protein YqfA (hemolysin III family)
MSNTTMPSAPNRRPLALVLTLVIVLVGLGSLYVKATQVDEPRWVGLAAPLMMGLFGLLYWLVPEMSRLSPTWQRRAVIFFFGMSALMLILYFV